MSLAKRILIFLGVSLLVQVLGLGILGYYVFKNKDQTLPPSIIQSLTKVDRKILEGVAFQHKIKNETARNLIAYELLELNRVDDVEFLKADSVDQLILKLDLHCRKMEGSVRICIKSNNKDVVSFVPVRIQENVIGYLKLGKSLSSSFVTSKDVFLVVITIIVAFILNMTFIIVFWLKYLRPDLQKIIAVIHSGAPDSSIQSKEYLEIQNKVVESFKRIGEAEQERITLERAIERETIYKQVAHDIQSPLSSIKAGIYRLTSNDKERAFLQKCLERLTDILSELSLGRKSMKTTVELGEFLKGLVEEKVIEYRDRSNLNIVFKNEARSPVFTKVILGDLGRSISNLINNAVEATGEVLNEVRVSVMVMDRKVLISIQDRGRGIDKKHLDHILSEGGSFGKPQGSGIGIPSSQRFVKDNDGSFEMESQIGVGTIARLMLPLSSNIIESGQIQIKKSSRIIIADDDKIIHLHWKRILKDFPNEVSYYYCVEDLPKLDLSSHYVIFSDYDFGPHEGDGYDCYSKIKSSGVTFDFYLVTGTALSSIETDVIPNIIPKSNLGLIDLKSLSETKKIILLDDEEIVHLNWKYEAERKGVGFLSFFTPSELLLHLSLMDEKETPVYIDYELGSERNGIEVAKMVADLGFKNIIITTGYDDYALQQPEYVQKIQSKEFPVS